MPGKKKEAEESAAFKKAEVLPPGEVKIPQTVTSITDSSDILLDVKEGVKFAKELANYIKEQKLTVKIKGNEYVKVEGWQFAGINFGVIPIVRKLEALDGKPTTFKYRCEVELIRLANNQVVGCGIGMCSSEENSKKTFDEYAIASMAQTRAIAKSYRNLFAWLIKSAGFAPTPAEEMDEFTEKATTEQVLKNQEKVKQRKKRRKKKKAEEDTQTPEDDDDDSSKDDDDTGEENKEPQAPDTDDDFQLVLD